MKITVEMIMAEKPCSAYHASRVEALFDGREALSPAEVATLDIPLSDRAWILGRMISHHDPTRSVARRIVRDAFGDRAVGVHVTTIWAASRAAARDAAWAAAWDAAWDAAWAAAWDAARDAAAFDSAFEKYIVWMVEFLEGVE